MTHSVAIKTDSAAVQKTLPRRARNWPLIAGWVLTALVLAIAVAGPWSAPHDPLERYSALQIDGKWVGPPFPAGTPGFLLGSDGAGRDLLSRVLWAARPTMILVTLIALLRLLLGMAIGIAAGWTRGPAEAVLDGLITLSLLVPVLVVALAVIAWVGIQRGLLAFVLGLTLTGWAETARHVEAQARIVRGQPFVEAARAAGGGQMLIVINHVLRHLLPQTGMLFSLEVSTTLMATAALGFLGYYVGGGVWITVGDFAATSDAGLPELGQMLATSLERILDPWPMLVVGGVVVLIMLAFILLGEGLRRQLDATHGRTATWSERLVSSMAATSLIVGAAVQPSSTRSGQVRLRWATVVFVILVGFAAGAAALRMSTRPNSAAPPETLAVPGGHAWAGGRHDPYGTLTARVDGPRGPDVLWEYVDPTGFVGGPVIAADGTLYVTAMEPALVAIAPDGREQWRQSLPAAPVGAPALGDDGSIYVVDHDRGLSLYGPSGKLRWRSVVPDGPRPTSGPLVAWDGAAYFAQGARIRKVEPNGDPGFLTEANLNAAELMPRLSPDGQWLMLIELAVRAADGASAGPPPQVGDEFGVSHPGYIVGADGNIYFLAGPSAVQVSLESGAAEPMRYLTADLGGINIYLPSDAGVASDGSLWFFFGSEYTTARLIWFDDVGRMVQNLEVPLRGARLLGFDDAGVGYICAERGAPSCVALDPASPAPLWELRLPAGNGIAGGAIATGRLYAASGDGHLFALQDEQSN